MKKVITYGTFDLFHKGHLNLLRRAKELGDYLIVGITTEQYDQARGKLNVVDTLITRIDNVRASGFVDEIVIEDHPGQKIEDIQKYEIDVFCVGSDWLGYFEHLKKYCEVVYLPRTKDVSSTILRCTENPIIRLGIVGTGRVAERFPQEAKYVSGASIESVFNPNREHALKFAEKHELRSGEDNYEEFIKKVDAVYIASPHETHYEYAKRALLHGKHVLCEKPMVLSKTQAEELFDLAHKRNLVLMEAIKTAYCPGFKQLINAVRSGIIGDVCDVEASFSRLTEDGKREIEDRPYGGAFTEFGSYCLLPIIKLLGRNYQGISFESILMDNGLDAYTKASLRYADAMALTKTGLKVKTEGQLIIAGTKGYIVVPSPWWLPTSFEVRYEDPNQKDIFSSTFLGKGIRYEVADFINAIGKIRKNESSTILYNLSGEESIAIAEIMEKFLEEQERI